MAVKKSSNAALSSTPQSQESHYFIPLDRTWPQCRSFSSKKTRFPCVCSDIDDGAKGRTPMERFNGEGVSEGAWNNIGSFEALLGSNNKKRKGES